MSDHVRDEVPRVAAFDIDGVLADVRHRLHFLDVRPRDWDGFFGAVSADGVLAEGADLVRAAVESGLGVVYLTGRPERCRADTVQWLASHVLPEGELVMRADTDRRPARLAKLSALRGLSARAEVAYVVDDDPEVAAALAAAGYDVRLAEWMPRAAPLAQAQESLGRT